MNFLRCPSLQLLKKSTCILSLSTDVMFACSDQRFSLQKLVYQEILSDLVVAQPLIISSSLPEILAAYVNLLQSSLLQGATLTASLNFVLAIVQAEIPQKPSFEVL